MKKPRWKLRDAEPVDLNLTAFLDMMVTIIPFLILTSAFVRLSGISGVLPAMVNADAAQQEESLKRDATFEVKDGKVTLRIYEKNMSEIISSAERTFELTQISEFKAYLKEVGSQYAPFRVSLFYASPESKYSDAVRVLDAVKAEEPLKNIVFAVGSVE